MDIVTGVDGLDHRIIDHLTRDGRATYGAVGAAVGLSAPAVKRRMDGLVHDGIIRRFTIDVDRAAVVGRRACVIATNDPHRGV